ncbi:MAG: TIGR02206 family membrane protein [Chloroflexi bacterium]|nr:MAG: TIGR02206 family membrane protein [Chloroflexota bacterium]
MSALDLSAEHLITVGVIAVAVAALVVGARMRPGPWTVPAARALAVLIVVNETSWFVWEAAHHAFTIQNDLPLHLCDVAAYISAVALWLRTPLLVELTYFWGIAGTANGVITPDIGNQFPSYLFFQYFIQHAAIPAAGLFLVVGLKIYPRPWAVPRVIGSWRSRSSSCSTPLSESSAPDVLNRKPSCISHQHDRHHARLHRVGYDQVGSVRN